MTITREIVRMLDKRDQKPPVGNHAHPQYLTTAVTSLKKTGGTPLTGNVELAEGANIILTQDDVLKKITITADSASTFLALTDTPADYVAQAGKAIVVKSTEDGLEFGVAPSGGVFSQTFGDGIATTFDLVHNLNTADVLIELWDLTTGTTPQLATSAAQLYEAINVNTVRITFSVAPAINKYRAVIISSGGAVGVSTIKTTGGAGISGDVELVAGTNVTLTQDDALKKITIAASGGGGFHAWTFTDPAETIGEPSLGTLTGSTYSSLTTSVLLGRAIRISSVLWVVGVAETWTLEIDGVVVATASSTGGTETITFNVGGLVVAAGQHNFALLPSTNSLMHYVAGFTFIDRWLRIEGWVEVGGDYHAPLQLVCEPGSLTAF